jgi:hypothetical protein
MLAAEATSAAPSGNSAGTVMLYDYKNSLRKGSIWKEPGRYGICARASTPR